MNCPHKLQPSEVIPAYGLTQQTITGPLFGWGEPAESPALHHGSATTDRAIARACAAQRSALAAGAA